MTLFTIKPPLHALLYGASIRTHQIELLARAGSTESYVRCTQFGSEDAAISDKVYSLFLHDRIDRLNSLTDALSKELQADGLTNTGRKPLENVAALISELSSAWTSGSVRHPFHCIVDCAKHVEPKLSVLSDYLGQERGENNLRKWCDLGIAVVDVFLPEADESHLVPWAGVIDWSERYDLDYAEWSEIEAADFDWRETTRVNELLDSLGTQREAILPLPREYDTEQAYFQKLTPRVYPEWYRVELGFDRLIYGTRTRRPSDARSDLFLKWAGEMAGENKQVNKAISERWNAMDSQERERISPGCKLTVAPQTVKKSRQEARQRQLLEVAMRDRKIF